MKDLIRQAQLMQKKMAKVQEEVVQRVVEATAGGGMVTVQANGAQEISAYLVHCGDRVPYYELRPDDYGALQRGALNCGVWVMASTSSMS